MDNELSMKAHITSLVKACFGILRQLKSVSHSLPRDTTRQLVQCLILSRIDYCNVAFSNLPKQQLDRLQSVINASARLVARVRKYDHITPVLRDELRVLKVRERLQFKLCLLVFKCLHNLAPSYLQQHIIPLADDLVHQRLRASKSADVFLPRFRTLGGDRAFCVAGPKAWNSLPAFIQEITNINTFKRLLKAFILFLV
jgi:hypothetical protein